MSSPNYTLSELQLIEGLSVRACNVCEQYGLKDLVSIIEYFKKRKNFFGLHNSGRRTDQELTLLCQIYDDGSILSEEEKAYQAIPRFPPLKELSQLQHQVLDDFARQKLLSLSQRGQTCMTFYFRQKITFEGIYRKFIEGKIDIEVDIRNSGPKTEQELISYVKEIYEKYTYVLELSDEILRLGVFKGWVFWQYQVIEAEFKPYEQFFLENRFSGKLRP